MEANEVANESQGSCAPAAPNLGTEYNVPNPPCLRPRLDAGCTSVAGDL